MVAHKFTEQSCTVNFIGCTNSPAIVAAAATATASTAAFAADADADTVDDDAVATADDLDDAASPSTALKVVAR